MRRLQLVCSSTLTAVALACGSCDTGSNGDTTDAGSHTGSSGGSDGATDGNTSSSSSSGGSDAGKDASDGGGISCAGPFSIQNQQPVECLPYPGSLWNKALPADTMSHLLPNSDAIVRNVFTGAGTYTYPWGRDQGGVGVVSVSANGYDGNQPLYYGQATDPVYRIASCTRPSSGIHNPIGMTFHIPSGATYNWEGTGPGTTDGGDNMFSVWDQTSNLLFSTYISAATLQKVPQCPGNGHAGTASDPCPWSLNDPGLAGEGDYCSVSNWDTDPGLDLRGGDSLGNGGWATHIRNQEMISGHIRHALYILSNCAAGTVFPAASEPYHCSDTTNRPPAGAHFFLDYTPSQLADIKSKVSLWQYELLEALAVYGGYFGDTYGSNIGTVKVARFESPAAYNVAGVPYPLVDWFKTFPYGTQNSDKSQPLYCYTWNSVVGCDFNPYTNVPLYTGPSCPATACDISQHMHIADPCIALGLAGQPGGCN